MDYILYNPLSSGGKCLKKVNKIEKNYPNEYQKISLLDIKDTNKFLKSLKEDDKIIIVGGDGTLNRIINHVDLSTIMTPIYLAKAGTGNDLFNDIDNGEEYIKLNDYFLNSPSVYYNTHLLKYNNSCGMGLDGDICYLVNNDKKKKNPFNYFKNCIKAAVSYQRYDLKLICDGKEYNYQKVWIATCMNGRYFGGGMKIAPNQNRLSEELTFVVVTNASLLKLLFILPKVYKGTHVKHTKYVKFITGKKFEVNASIPQVLEIDGEVVPNIKKFTITK